MSEDSQFDIPEYIKKRFEGDELKAVQEEQARLRSRYGYDANRIRTMSRVQRDFEHNEREVLLASEMLGVLLKESPLPEAEITFQRRRLSEALWRTGKLEEALIAAADKAQFDKVLAIKAAVESDDLEVCNCEDAKHKGLNITRYATKTHIFSPKHGKIMPMKQCSICGHLNCCGNIPARPKDSILRQGVVR